jgi:S-adenosylmethionine hydrolase
VTPRPIALLTDFGLRDPSAGICRAVILSVDPRIPLIDITHGVARQDLRAGAVTLADAVPYLPGDCVVVAVVDPGVGSGRRALALACADGRVLVGPDNGLLMPAAAKCGGVLAGYEISGSQWRLEPVSSTFHGRDVFAPVAARIASGGAVRDAGEPIDRESLVPLELPSAEPGDGALGTTVVAVDEYGNLRLAAGAADIGVDARAGRLELDTGSLRRELVFADNYAAGADGQPLLIVDSTGSLSIAVNRASAADTLRLGPGSAVTIAW